MRPRPRRDAVPTDAAEVILTVRDRSDTLERVFGTMRRRGMTLTVLSLARFGDDLVLVLRGGEDGPVPGRWLAELDSLVDVLEVRATGPAERPDGGEGHDDEDTDPPTGPTRPANH